MNSISHKWISRSFYYPRTYELCPTLKPTVSSSKTKYFFTNCKGSENQLTIK